MLVLPESPEKGSDRFAARSDRDDPAGHRETYDKISRMNANPKSTQFPVKNMIPRVRVVGCASNDLSLFIGLEHGFTRERGLLIRERNF